jgi:hypothetical protein
MACSDVYDFCGNMIFDGKVTTSILRRALHPYGVTLTGDWSLEDASAAYFAVFDVGARLAETSSQSDTPSQAFSNAFETSSNSLVLNWNQNCYYCRTDEQIKACDDRFGGDCTGGGGVTLGSYYVDFQSLSPIFPGFNNGELNIVHELGHVFNRHHVVDDTTSLAEFDKYQDGILKNPVLRSDNSGYDIWRFHPHNGTGDMLADMFVAYVSGEWNSSNVGGYRDRAIYWMNHFIYSTTVY